MGTDESIFALFWWTTNVFPFCRQEKLVYLSKVQYSVAMAKTHILHQKGIQYVIFDHSYVDGIQNKATICFLWSWRQKLTPEQQSDQQINKMYGFLLKIFRLVAH